MGDLENIIKEIRGIATLVTMVQNKDPKNLDMPQSDFDLVYGKDIISYVLAKALDSCTMAEFWIGNMNTCIGSNPFSPTGKRYDIGDHWNVMGHIERVKHIKELVNKNLKQLKGWAYDPSGSCTTSLAQAIVHLSEMEHWLEIELEDSDDIL